MRSRRRSAGHDQPRAWPVADATSRLVALGDPHGAIARVRAVLERERDGRTALVSVGDVVGYASGERCSELVALLAAEGVPSVVGNHEHWMAADGRMFLPGDTGDIRVSPEARDAIAQWPWDLQVRLPNLPVRVTHSIHHPTWDWVTPETAPALLDRVAPDTVVCVGHSHRPALYGYGPAGVWWREPFEFTAEESIERPIQPGWRYLIDCGSLARPESQARPRRHRQDWGTYGVVDAAAGTVALRRVR